MEQEEFAQPETQDNLTSENQEIQIHNRNGSKRMPLFIFLGLLGIIGLLFIAYKTLFASRINKEESTPTLFPMPTDTPILTPTIIEPTITPVPTKMAFVPSKVPTKIIVPTLIPITQTPTQLPNPQKELRCEANASPMAGPAPLEVTFSYTVLNIGTGYVIGAQWDFNGDGNWDTDLNINTGRVNYTYSTVGVYTVRLKAQLSDGRTTECSTSVVVQPH